MGDLTKAQNERLRAAMRARIDDLYKGNISELARELKRKQPSISNFINGGGASYETAKRFAAVIGKTFSEVVGEAEGVPMMPPPAPESPEQQREALILEAVRDMRGQPPEKQVAMLMDRLRPALQHMSVGDAFEEILKHLDADAKQQKRLKERVDAPTKPHARRESVAATEHGPKRRRRRQA